MSQMLADLIAAHKALCEAVAQAGGTSLQAPAQGQVASQPRVPRQDDQYLTDEEEERMAREFGMDRNPLMEQIVEKQFAELLKKRPKREEEADGSEKYAVGAVPPRPNFAAPEPHYEPTQDHDAPPPMPLPIIGPKNGATKKLNPSAILQDFSDFSFDANEAQ